MNETNNNNNFSQNIWMEIFFHQIFIITNPCITNIVISNKKLNSCRRRCFFKQIFAKDYLFGAIYTVFTKKQENLKMIKHSKRIPELATKKIRLGSKLALGLINGLSFRVFFENKIQY